jgi:hypothetical protein
MSKQLIKIVLPQLAERLHRQVRRYRAGQLTDAQFAKKFEDLVQNQYAWLSEHGVPDVQAAVAVQGAVLVLTGPGLRAEAEEEGVPLELIESRAIRDAAADIARSHGASERRIYRQLSTIIAHYGE